MRTRIAGVALLLVGLITGLLSAQVLKWPLPVDPIQVLSGADVGFQVKGMRGDTAVGTLVVKRNGKWMAAKAENEAEIIR